MTPVEHPQLPLARKPDRTVVPMDLVRAQKTFEAALALACQASGLEPKEIAAGCDIDTGQFSRILSGGAHFPGNKYERFCDVVGNTVILDWMAHRVGRGLVLLQSEAERRAVELEESLARVSAENRMLKDILQGKA